MGDFVDVYVMGRYVGRRALSRDSLVGRLASGDFTGDVGAEAARVARELQAELDEIIKNETEAGDERPD